MKSKTSDVPEKDASEALLYLMKVGGNVYGTKTVFRYSNLFVFYNEQSILF